MSELFELLSAGRLPELGTALTTEPDPAALRHASGASLLAWAHYVGQPSAVDILRPFFPTLSPHDAIILGDREALDRALATGWDANERAPDGFTPLGLAAFFGRREIFDLLLPLTKSLDDAATNPQRVAALHAATARRDAGMVEALLRAGATPDLTQAGGMTPLHVAAAHGDAAIVGLLLLFGADRRKTDDQGRDAIAHARAGGWDWLADRLSA